MTQTTAAGMPAAVVRSVEPQAARHDSTSISVADTPAALRRKRASAAFREWRSKAAASSVSTAAGLRADASQGKCEMVLAFRLGAVCAARLRSHAARRARPLPVVISPKVDGEHSWLFVEHVAVNPGDRHRRRKVVSLK